MAISALDYHKLVLELQAACIALGNSQDYCLGRQGLARRFAWPGQDP